MKMKVWHCGVARVAGFAQEIATVDALSLGDCNGVLAKVSQDHVVAVIGLDDHVVSRGIGGIRYQVQSFVVFHVVSHFDHLPINGGVQG